MKRLAGRGYGAVIQAAEQIIPMRIRPLVVADYFCGADPVFADLHRYTAATYGRSYADTAHTVYDFHQPHRSRRNRTTTVVLPSVPSLDTVVHELGHVLHERLRFEPHARPVSWYAETDHREAFAEAFTSWLLPNGHRARPDDETLALFEELSA